MAGRNSGADSAVFPMPWWPYQRMVPQDTAPNGGGLPQEGQVSARRPAGRRRRTVVALGTSLALLALIGAVIIGDSPADTPERAPGTADTRALSRRLAAESRKIAATDIRLARRLAATAWHLARTDEARVSLLNAFLHPERAVLAGRTEAVTGLDFGNDGVYLAAVDENGMVRVWNATSGEPLEVYADHGPALAVSAPGPSYLFTVGSDGSERERTRDGFLSTSNPYPRPLRAAAISPDGLHVATAGEDGFVDIWHKGGGYPGVTSLVHPRPVTDLDFSLNGGYLATASEDGTARLWDADSGELLAVTGGRRKATAVAAAPAGRSSPPPTDAPSTFGMAGPGNGSPPSRATPGAWPTSPSARTGNSSPPAAMIAPSASGMYTYASRSPP